MYKWMDYIISPKVNAEVAQYFGEAPAQSKACDVDADAAAKARFPRPSSATSTTPRIRRSGSGSTTGRRRWPIAATTAATDCKDYNDWVNAWTEIKG